jgi:hypothetical protein
MGDDMGAQAGLVVLTDLGLAGQEDGESVAGFADPRQRLTRREASRLAETPQPRHFRRRQRGEHLRAAGGDNRLWRLVRHIFPDSPGR